ncbi:hypothetical protein N0V90_004102 [Kalmusia sp. IMI 367209]|nr:hypothetical protein N0V90_004102 [Kalmusia sp. IMI 367209]
MEAPPYSATIARSERRVPDDYGLETERGSAKDTPQSLCSQQTSLEPSTSAHTSQTASSRSDLETYDPNLAPTLLHTSSDLPPTYTPADALARNFVLSAPFICTTRTSNLPRYHLKQDLSHSGKPTKLSMRRLLPAEARALSHSSSLPLYDDSTTLYTCIVQAPLTTTNFSRTFEMRGRRSSALSGIVTFHSSKNLLGRGGVKVWHWTRSATRDALRPENEARMNKYGYRAEEEWNKRLLFSVKGVFGGWEWEEVAWEDGKGIEKHIDDVLRN